MSRRLPDIRELDGFDRPPRPGMAWIALSIVLTAISALLVYVSIDIVWSSAREVGIDRIVIAVPAALVVLFFTWIYVRAIRSDGLGMVPYLAVIFPVVAWLCAICVLWAIGAYGVSIGQPFE